jgi:hypothetical protein
VTVQVVPEAERHPDHPAKTEAASGVAVKVTSVEGVVFGTDAVQPAVEPDAQATPGPVTVPAPGPFGFTVSGHVLGWNVAYTVRAPPTLTVQLAPETVRHPDQPAKTELPSGVATSVTSVAGLVFGMGAVHPAVEPDVQAMPGPVTVPTPVPFILTVTAHVLGTNVAVTVRAPTIETVQAFPETAVQPDQPVNSDEAFGVATSVTSVAGVVFGTGPVQPAVEPVVQERPAPATVPAPVPLVFTVSVHWVGWNVAVTVRAPAIETVQRFPTVVLQPAHPVKSELASGVAVRVTSVAGLVFGMDAVQPAADPVVQERPGPAMVPTPVPDVLAVSGHVLGWK